MIVALWTGWLVLGAVPTAGAQESRGTLQGRVTDQSGGVVPGATVEVANVATGVTASTTANEEGNYRVPFLNPGTYLITVTLEGFSKFVSQQVELHVADILTVDASLQAGGVRDTVTVSASAAVVDTTSAGLGQVVDARRISELPIREGTAVELVILAPGVQNTTDLQVPQGGVQQRAVAVGQRWRRRKTQRFHHRRRRERRGRPRGLQSAVRCSRGVQDPDLDLRRGCRQRHGRLGQPRDQERHQQPSRSGLRVVPRRALDSKNYFDAKAGRAKRDYKDNRFGAAVGGPIARSRTFYFANVEANPFQVPSPATLTVPSEKMRNGDFSELLALGSAYQIYDPATTRPHPTLAGRFIRDQFPGNIIPANRISPVARNILGYYPLPNLAGTADGANNYNNPTAVAFETYYTATTRVDHNLSDRHRIYGRFSWDFWEEEKSDRFDNLSTGIFLNRKNRVFALDDAYTLKSNLLVNVRGGFTRQLFPERRRSQGFDLSSLGFANALTSLVPADAATFPNVAFDGYQSFSPWESGDGFFTTDVYNAIGSLLWLRPATTT